MAQREAPLGEHTPNVEESDYPARRMRFSNEKLQTPSDAKEDDSRKGKKGRF